MDERLTQKKGLTTYPGGLKNPFKKVPKEGESQAGSTVALN